MASRLNKRFRWKIALTSLMLLHGLVHAAPAPEPDPGPSPDPSALAVISDDFSGSSSGDELFLEVVLNGSHTRKVAHFNHDGAHWHASVATLRQLGFRLPGDAPDVRIDMASVDGMSVNYDEPRQLLHVTAPAAMLDQETNVLNAVVVDIPQPQASPGVLVNYDVYATHDSKGGTGVSAFNELRAFNGWGVLSNTSITRATDVSTQTQRLDTTFSRSFVGSATTLRIGDAITSSLSWSRATRFGGIQFGRNFALQPDLITFPVPAFYGQAALPSTVDLYINGLKRYSGDVAGGPFQLNTIPVVNGNGSAQVVITDALGRQSTLDFDFYTTSQLLRPGLSDYSLEAGFVRKNYGVDSFSYDSNVAASGSYRYGVRDWLTMESHAEATAGVSNGGVGAIVALGRTGVLNAAVAGSRGGGQSGSQAELGYNWRNERFSLSLGSIRSSGDYRDIASSSGFAPPRVSDRAQASVLLGRVGSFGINYVALEYPEQARSRYGGVYYFRSLGRQASLNLSLNQNLDTSRDRSVFLGVSFSLDHSVAASVSVQHDRSGNALSVDASRSINPDGGLGWRLRAQDGSGNSGGMAEVGFRGERGQVLAGAQSLNGNSQIYGDASGALIWMDSQFFAARQVQDSFAVVSTNGVANVPVLLENRPIGITNSRGDLLVTPLNAYQRNKLTIDPMQLPADVRIDRVDADVVPSDRAGTLVRFGIKPVAAASIILHDASGKPLKVGTTVDLRGSSEPTGMLGYDGIVYLEGLGEHNTLDVHTDFGSCTVRFDYRAEKDTLPVIGPLRCAGKSQ